MDDELLVSRVLAGETALYELLMRRYNQRLYRVARAILHDDAEAEDVMQDAYVRGYQHLAAFEGRAKFSTWLTRIGLHEALARDPEEAAYNREFSDVLRRAILKLSEDYRLVFMLRDVEGMTTDETAECLNLTPENVKVRLHRARAGLHKELYVLAGATTVEFFQFHATRCDRVVKNVFRMRASKNKAGRSQREYLERPNAYPCKRQPSMHRPAYSTCGRQADLE